jgi:phosphotransferase system  glucose/maltose/N-acetylglucosamine-specific IIC component
MVSQNTEIWKRIVPPPRYAGLLIFLQTLIFVLWFFISLPPVGKWLSLLITLITIKQNNTSDENVIEVAGGMALVVGAIGGCLVHPMLEQTRLDSSVTGSLTLLWTTYLSCRIYIRLF